MGNFCATDIYKEVKEKNPEEFQQYLIGEEVKKSLTERVNSVKSKVTATADDIQKENLGIINSKEAEVKSQFDKAKADIDKYYLGGVKGLEQTKNAKAQDLLGYSAIEKKFETLKSDVTSNFKAEKERVQAELSALQKQTTEKVSSNQPKVSFLDTLSDKLKKEVYQSGVKEYKDKIEAHSKNILEPLQKQLQPDHFTNRFKNFLPVDSLKGLTTNSKNQINDNLKALIGAPEEGRAVLG